MMLGAKLRGTAAGLCLAFLGAVPLGATEVSPLSISLFGDYGTPVQPLGLTQSTTDAIGGEFLAEWNPASMASIGLGLQTEGFFSSSTFSILTLDLEGRLFPWDNGIQKFSPYLFGATGLNLGSNGGPIHLKAGLGSRVHMAGPIFLDVAVGSHWFTDPNSLQYVDARAGLSFSIDLKPAATPTPTPLPPTATPVPASPSPTVTMMPMVTDTPTPGPAQVISLDGPTATPIPVIDNEPVSSVEESKKYYDIGMEAFLAGNHPVAMKALRKSLNLKEKHKHPYKYAEAYATLGVIYEFHAHKVKDHDRKALECYKKALAIDPRTKSARHYYPRLKAKLEKEAKTAKKKAAAKKTSTVRKKGKAVPKSEVRPTPVPTPAPVSNDSMDLRSEIK
ncbi:MAG TPA: hypothetical protein VHE12_13775 [bacterium]|nr:hypothetical protein [bacterium]